MHIQSIYPQRPKETLPMRLRYSNHLSFFTTLLGALLCLSSAGADESPVMTLLGDDPITIFYGDYFSDPGVTVIDAEDGEISRQVNPIYPFPIDSLWPVGDWPVVYLVGDSGSNSVQAGRTVKVARGGHLDTTPPVITLAGEPVMEITLGSSYQEPGALAWDDVEGWITDRITIDTSQVTILEPGLYTVTYSVADRSGNQALSVTRTLHVVPGPELKETPKPILPKNGAEGLTFPITLQVKNLGGMSHAKSHWQISANEGFSGESIVYDFTGSANLFDLTLSQYAPLESETLYYWHVRFISSDNKKTAWSETFSFTTGVKETEEVHDPLADDEENSSNAGAAFGGETKEHGGCFISSQGFFMR